MIRYLDIHESIFQVLPTNQNNDLILSQGFVITLIALVAKIWIRWGIVVGWFYREEDQNQVMIGNNTKGEREEGNVLFVAQMNDELSWYTKTMFASKWWEERYKRNNASS